MTRPVPASEVSKHNTPDSLWLVVDGVVYDLTDFAPTHPGGIAVLRKHAGRDATAAYNQVHASSLIRSALDPAKVLGDLDLDRSNPPDGWSPVEQATPPSPPRLGEKGRAAAAAPAEEDGGVADEPQQLSPLPLTSLISAHNFEAAAERLYSAKTWAFLSSAATDLHTKRRNAAAYSAIGLRPRVLRDVSSVSTATAMLGRRIPYPIFCSPTSLGRLFHRDGEKALGRACARLGIPQCISTSASFPLSEIVEAVREVERELRADGRGQGSQECQGDGQGEDAKSSPHPGGIPIFFQLYVDKNRAKSTAILREAASRRLGISAVFLTVDSPVPGKREADERISADEAVAAPMTATSARNDAKGGALGRVMGSYIDASVSWADIPWLRASCPGVPLVLKGVQTAADARLAVDAGVDAILLSNHGGRSVDTSPPAVCVLLELHKCCPEVFDKVEVYVDGGVSRGTDIFKALCLGARVVGIGRGMLYGLAYGEEGVERYIEVLVDELETTMKNCGVTSLDQVHAGLVNTLAIDHLIPDTADHPYAKWRPGTRSRL